MRRKVGETHLRLAECGDLLLRASGAQGRDENRWGLSLSFGTRQEARHALRRADPEVAAAVLEDGDNLSARESVGGGVVLDVPGRGVEPVEAPPRADVDAPVRVFPDGRS